MTAWAVVWLARAWCRRRRQVTSAERRIGQAVEQTATDFDEDCCLTASEAVAYGLAGEVVGGPVGAPESGTPA